MADTRVHQLPAQRGASACEGYSGGGKGGDGKGGTGGERGDTSSPRQATPKPRSNKAAPGGHGSPASTSCASAQPSDTVTATLAQLRLPPPWHTAPADRSRRDWRNSRSLICWSSGPSPAPGKPGALRARRSMKAALPRNTSFRTSKALHATRRR